jgi:two-component system CheB/CheR fusion protein
MTAASPLAGLELLVVDDSGDTAESFAMLLTLVGASVRTATSGADALRVLEEGGPCDVLISDLAMPGMSGYELVRALRARPAPRRVVALACSGWGREQDERAALEAGFDALLAKPVSLEQVEQAVATRR